MTVKKSLLIYHYWAPTVYKMQARHKGAYRDVCALLLGPQETQSVETHPRRNKCRNKRTELLLRCLKIIGHQNTEEETSGPWTDCKFFSLWAPISPFVRLGGQKRWANINSTFTTLLAPSLCIIWESEGCSLVLSLLLLLHILAPKPWLVLGIRLAWALKKIHQRRFFT